MATAKLFLSIICIAFISGNRMLNGSLLNQRAALVRAAISEVGVREQTGNNDGPRVEHYLRYVGFSKGAPWCAAYVSFIYSVCGYDKPRSAWSPDLFPVSRLTKTASAGNVLGIYFKQYGRIAHVGIVVKEDGDYIISVEGNTNVDGSRDGDGVYVKKRHRRTIYRLADWIVERRKT